MFTQLLQHLKRTLTGSPRRSRGLGAAVRVRFRPTVERLEHRRMPAAFVVNTISDTPDANNGDGLAQDAAGNTSLRACIEEGNASAPGMIRIDFDPALSGATIILNSPLQAFNNDFQVNGSLPVGGQTISVERNRLLGNYRVFAVNVGKTVNMNDLMIGYGRAPIGSNGGGILNNGTLNLYNVAVHDNEANAGGGIRNQGTLTLENCHVYDNHAFSGGGGISNTDGGQAWIQSSTEVFVNTADEIGGGILNGTDSQLTINGSASVYSNTAQVSGGGIFNTGQLTMSNALLYANECQQRGGGLYSDGASTLSNVSITSNKALGANGKGGGIYIRSGTTSLTDCTVSNNTCGLQGGGTGICRHPNGTLETINCTITDAVVQDPNP